jgi:hypothetical protein
MLTAESGVLRLLRPGWVNLLSYRKISSDSIGARSLESLDRFWEALSGRVQWCPLQFIRRFCNLELEAPPPILTSFPFRRNHTKYLKRISHFPPKITLHRRNTCSDLPLIHYSTIITLVIVTQSICIIQNMSLEKHTDPTSYTSEEHLLSVTEPLNERSYSVM